MMQIEENKELANARLENLVKEVSDLVDAFFIKVNNRQDKAELEFKSCFDQVQKNTKRIKKLEAQRVDEVLNDISRKMVTDLLRELLTPITLE